MQFVIVKQVQMAEAALASGNQPMAEGLLRQMLTKSPVPARVYELLAYIADGQGDSVACLHWLRQSLTCADASAQACYALGTLLLNEGQCAEAVSALRAALDRSGEVFEILHELGIAQSRSGQCMDAVACFDRAIALAPDAAIAYFNKARALEELGRTGQAMACYEQAATMAPAFAEAWSNWGVLLHQAGRHEAAMVCYDKALAARPDCVDAWVNRGTLLGDLKRYDEALAAYQQAFSLNPETPSLPGFIAFVKRTLCDWDGLVELTARIMDSVTAKSYPFRLLSLTTSRERLLASTHAYVTEHFPAPASQPLWPVKESSRPLRIAYLSSDFREHAVSFLTAGLYEHHDRARFEIVGVGLATAATDPMRSRVITACDRFVDLASLDREQAIAALRALELDIAVDLNGYTDGNRTEFFAARIAPIQVNYLGFPGTMGAPFIDYLIGDTVLIPPNHRDGYSEKIAYLPHCFQANDDKRVIGDPGSRRDHGLPEDGFVFCSFCNSYKLGPELFSVWLELLREIPSSVLWLLRSSDSQMARLRARAEAEGVASERLVFANHLPYDRHLARYRHADLALDTMPFGGGTTTSDALWVGAPVLTLLGETFAGRMSASLLLALGQHELVVDSLSAYLARALDLARSPERLAEIKVAMARQRADAPLFDTARFTRHLEAAYLAMAERQRLGLAPDHLHIAAGG